jgi:hypothetical protein
VLAAVCLAVAFAEDKKKEEERPKTFKRLIPADVLRGKPKQKNQTITLD